MLQWRFSAECKEYKKLTKSKGRVSGLHLLSSEEEEESEEGFYNCTRLNPFISGGQNVKKDEYLHMAGVQIYKKLKTF